MILNKKYISLLLFSIACCATDGLFAQQLQNKTKPDQYRAINWTMEDGLSDNLANVMIKDVKGFLWVGSISGELCRFDGADFKKLIPNKQKPGQINFDNIYALIEDSL